MGLAKVVDIPAWRDQSGVFQDRRDAGKALSRMLQAYRNTQAVILAIPAGGVEVGLVLAETLDLPLDVMIVSKITPRWDTEIGYGAVAFDGRILLNRDMIRGLGLSWEDIREDVKRTREKVRRRMSLLRHDAPFPDLAGKRVILVDDGLATGFTMRAAIRAVADLNAREKIIAVPTAVQRTIDRLKASVDALYCANIRAGPDFAVADAYRVWRDVTENEAAAILDDRRMMRRR